MIKEIDQKDFCKEFCKKWRKKNTWNIRSLVDDSFGPSSKATSVLYCRLTDFKFSKLDLRPHSLSGCKINLEMNGRITNENWSEWWNIEESAKKDRKLFMRFREQPKPYFSFTFIFVMCNLVHKGIGLGLSR